MASLPRVLAAFSLLFFFGTAQAIAQTKPAVTQPAAPVAPAPAPVVAPTQPTVDVKLATEAMALPNSPGYHQRHCHVTNGDEKFRMTYGLFLPANYFASKEKFPVVISLSTAGAKGLGGMNLASDGMCSFWTTARGDLPDTPTQVGVRKAARFIGVAPQCPGKYDWKTPPMPEAVWGLIEQLAQNYRIDIDRVYVTGFSYGGTSTWDIALALPTKFAAIVPISGRAMPDPEQSARTLKNVAIYLACGTADKTFFPLNQSMHDALVATTHPRFVWREVPGGGHGCYPAIYSDPTFWNWLYAQKRGFAPTTRPTTQGDTPQP